MARRGGECGGRNHRMNSGADGVENDIEVACERFATVVAEVPGWP